MRRTFTNPPWVPVLLAAALGCATAPQLAFAQQPPSAADLAQARELLNQGIRLREHGDIAGAVEKLKAAHAIAETPISASELGRTYVASGKLLEAREAFLSVARIPHRPAETERSAAARAESARLAEELRSRIPSITIRVTGASGSAVTVTIDGETVPAEALAAPRFVNPGAHELRAQSAAGAGADAKVDLKEGETREVALHLQEGPAPMPSSGLPANASSSTPPAQSRPLQLPPVDPASPTRRGQGQRIAGLAAAGAGIVALGAGGVLALVAKSQDNTAANETFPAKHDDSLNASHLANTATIVVGAGAAVAVIGGLVWLTAPRSETAVGTNGSGIWLRGSF